MLYFARIARASASVVMSGTVGPEPITDGSSPGTSEIARVITLRRRECCGQSPALDAREMFAHAIHFHDVCAACEQRARQRPFVVERNSVCGRDPVGRSATGHQHQHDVVSRRHSARASACVRRRQCLFRRAPDDPPRPYRFYEAEGRSRDVRPQCPSIISRWEVDACRDKSLRRPAPWSPRLCRLQKSSIGRCLAVQANAAVNNARDARARPRHRRSA